MKAVIYARFSCSKQREASISDQLRVCREWCQREGYEVVAEYSDHAVSGRTDERPEFQRMVRNAGESDIVLVYMMDRFSRDIYDAPIYKKRLRDKGVRVVSATEPLNDSPDAVLLEKIYEGLAAVESAHISQRTKRGMEGNALKCLHNGVRVFGYRYADDGRYEVDEDEAALVRECFARKLSGEPVNSIANDMARRGVTTYTGRPASYTFVYNLLKNEKYTGVYIWGDVRVDGGMPQIISTVDYRRAQTVKPRKQRVNEEWDAYLLTGKAVCSCGWGMSGYSARNHSGVKYRYYRCRCGSKPVRADWLEAEVASRVRGLLADRGSALHVAGIVSEYVHGGDASRDLERAMNRKADAERQVSNLTRAVAQGMEYALVKDDLEKLQSQLDACGREIAMLQSATSFDAEDFADFLQFGATLDDSHILELMVGQVLVEPESITVLLNYDCNGKPARIEFGRVSEDCGWLPVPNLRLTFTVVGGAVLLRFPRAA